MDNLNKRKAIAFQSIEEQLSKKNVLTAERARIQTLKARVILYKSQPDAVLRKELFDRLANQHRDLPDIISDALSAERMTRADVAARLARLARLAITSSRARTDRSLHKLRVEWVDDDEAHPADATAAAIASASAVDHVMSIALDGNDAVDHNAHEQQQQHHHQQQHQQHHQHHHRNIHTHAHDIHSQDNQQPSIHEHQHQQHRYYTQRELQGGITAEEEEQHEQIMQQHEHDRHHHQQQQQEHVIDEHSHDLGDEHEHEQRQQEGNAGEEEEDEQTDQHQHRHQHQASTHHEEYQPLTEEELQQQQQQHGHYHM